MPIAEFKQQLIDLLKENQYDKIFEELDSVENERIRKEATLLSSRKNRIEEDDRLGTLGKVVIRREFNQLEEAILALINEIEEEDTLTKQKEKKGKKKTETPTRGLDSYTSILGFITAIISLGILLYNISQPSDTTTSNQNTKINQEQVREEYSISKPLPEDTIVGNKKFRMSGKAPKKLPPNKCLMVFAKNKDYYYYLKQKDGINNVNGNWEHDGVFIGIPGDFRLILYLVDEQEADKIKSESPLGFKHAPNNADEKASVVIHRVIDKK